MILADAGFRLFPASDQTDIKRGAEEIVNGGANAVRERQEIILAM